MYRYRHNDVPKWYFACTEVVLQKTRTEIDLICTKVVMYRKCPPLCTETVMYRKRPNPSRRTGLNPWQIPNSILIGSAVLPQLTANSLHALQMAAPSSPSKFPLPTGVWTLDQYVVPLAQPSPKPKQRLQHFSSFCRADDRERPTDRQRYSICNNRPHLDTYYCNATYCLRFLHPTQHKIGYLGNALPSQSLN